MQAATATLELPRHDAARNARSSAPDLPDPLAQHLTRPTNLPHSAIDTSLKAIGL